LSGKAVASADMSAGFGNLRDDPALWAAQLALSQLARRVATTGFAAMRIRPALVARVDQHAAAVRDALTDVSGRVGALGLAAYADGVCDTATLRGWQMPDSVEPVHWMDPAWPLVRLLAVCVLAESTAALF
jgi:uncharacterized membrane protein